MWIAPEKSISELKDADVSELALHPIKDVTRQKSLLGSTLCEIPRECRPANGLLSF